MQKGIYIQRGGGWSRKSQFLCQFNLVSANGMGEETTRKSEKQFVKKGSGKETRLLIKEL